MEFNTQTKVKDIALSNPAARQILEESGVDYCCGGGKSLHDACVDASASPEVILNRLRENSHHATSGDANWLAASLRELTSHIREKHHRYVREAIPRTEALLQKVIAKHGPNHPELSNIHSAFAEVSREMLLHMRKEEQILFPYIESLELAVAEHRPMEPPFFETVKNPVHAMMNDHDAAGELLKRIRSLSADYTPPPDACLSFKSLYEDLKQFESDLRQHVHLENNILFPRSVEMESALPPA
jgi:regulator of cell morphogenesis and NO signaling